MLLLVWQAEAMKKEQEKVEAELTQAHEDIVTVREIRSNVTSSISVWPHLSQECAFKAMHTYLTLCRPLSCCAAPAGAEGSQVRGGASQAGRQAVLR